MNRVVVLSGMPIGQSFAFVDKHYGIQGNLKGESVVVAILLSRMEVSYCTSGFFCSQACQVIGKYGSPWSSVTSGVILNNVPHDMSNGSPWSSVTSGVILNNVPHDMSSQYLYTKSPAFSYSLYWFLQCFLARETQLLHKEISSQFYVFVLLHNIISIHFFCMIFCIHLCVIVE